MTQITIISAGMGQPSTSRMLADRYSRVMGEVIPEADMRVISLRELAVDITNASLAGFANAELQSVLDRVSSADALVAIGPIFNGSYSGLFKTFFDIVDDGALIGKPVLLAATGGTARHSLAIDHALRPLFAYLQAFAMPTGVFAAPEDWSGEDSDAVNQRIRRAVDELASVLSGAGTGRGPTDEFDLSSPTFLAASRP